MPREDVQLNAAKRSYRNAKAEGNRQEEARWANVIGDILKNRGEYVEALKWLRIDYEVSIKYLPEKHLLPTCQSLGEVYLRLEYFKDALIYQKKHLEMAKEASDLVEQQRASTQLGRTYHEIFLRSENDHYSVRNAKKYFKSSMKLAKFLKDNPPDRSSFLKEFIDAHNNMGMLEIDLDNLEEAKRVLIKGLEICDDEEVSEDDDGRSRLHHNLGNVYMELRMWNEAQEHIEKDIIICKKIRHCQGEAKGYINLGELHYRVQKYDEALRCYQKALNLAKSMEDEDALARHIDQNIETVKQAMKVMDELKKEEQNLKKLMRDMATARGTTRERKCLLQQNVSLDCLIEKSSMIFAWTKHHQFAKRKKRIASELCDKEKLSDSYLVIGEAYQKLRKFKKSLKWYTKSWDIYKSIGNLEGQALAKINIGDVFDCDGKWAEALDAFGESYRIAVEANLPSVRLSALENMHYSYMIRFDNIEEARRLQILIDELKESKKRNLETKNVADDCCSETDTEANEQLSDSMSDAGCSPVMKKSCHTIKSSKMAGSRESCEEATLVSILGSPKSSQKMDTVKGFSESTSNPQTVIGRKRVRVVLSDDEDESQDEVEMSKRSPRIWPREDVATSDEYKRKNYPGSPACEFQDVSAAACKCASGSCNNIVVESTTSSLKSRAPSISTQNDKALRFSSADDQCITFKIDDSLIHLEATALITGDKSSIASVRDELACLYYLRLPVEKRTDGLLPVIKHITCGGRTLESLEMIESHKEHREKILVETVIDGWVSKPLIKLYIDHCKELSEAPNVKLLRKLYNLEASDDEVVVSECDLQDKSISPLLNALHAHKTFAVLDLSHNLLGNGTMEKIQQVFTHSSQTHDLTLDLHCNRFGPTALFQICECPVLFTRLEVLNISGNRLTDACGSYISTILKNCKGLWSLNVERCSITSRTIQRVADALDVGSALGQLFIGYNSPISGNTITNLLAKLASLNRFARLNLNGLKLSTPAIDSLCQLAKTPCFSGLMLASTGIGNDAALQITKSLFEGSEEFVKLDLAYCGLTSEYLTSSLIQRIQELNLAGNPILQEGSTAVSNLIKNSHCCLKVLLLNGCQLGLAGVLQIIQALSENCCLEELNLADNVDLDKYHSLQPNIAAKETLELLNPLNPPETSSTTCLSNKEVDPPQEQLEVADSEDQVREEAAASGVDDSCAKSYQKNISSADTEFILRLSAAVGMAKSLQLLDLSNNGFSEQVAETLYTAWSNSRSNLARKHIKDETVHLLVDGIKCCFRPCCKKN